MYSNDGDYIFCPLCGASKWISDKTGSVENNKLSLYRCTACKKFQYTNITVPYTDTFLHAVTQIRRYSVKAELEKYCITVLYAPENQTTIRDAETFKELIKLNKPIEFNWYRPEEVAEKVKFYLVFS